MTRATWSDTTRRARKERPVIEGHDHDQHSRGQHRIERLDHALATGRSDEAAWYAGVRAVLESSYLASDDPYAQSGMRADAARWERGRRPITDAINRGGTFLDVGCANGLLMERRRRVGLGRWSPP